MPLVLAVEPDSSQAEALTPIVEQRVGAELVLVGSKDAAVQALSVRVPDLVLVSALLSPRDEAELTNYLRTLAHAVHLETLTIPMLAPDAGAVAQKRRLPFGLGRLLSRPGSPEATGCDPEVFADEIRTYLNRRQGTTPRARRNAHGREPRASGSAGRAARARIATGRYVSDRGCAP